MGRPTDEALLTAISQSETLIRDTIGFIHDHPELPHEEHLCSQYLMDVLRSLGLHVEPGLAGMATGFKAVLAGADPGRTVGIVALYDAVASVPPEGGIKAVHSCGHGPIAGGVVGALAALAEHRDSLNGEVIVMGCPADEIHAPSTVARGSGKALSAQAGAWDAVDAALYVHPEFIDTVSQASLWMRRITGRVAGTRSLAERAEHAPLDAATVAVSTAQALPAGRGMLERLVLDGDVEDGGGLVTEMTFLIWDEDEAGLDALGSRLQASFDAVWTTRTTVPSIVPDTVTTAAVAEAVRASGRAFVDDPPALPFATDFGAVTRRVPSALIGVGRPEGWAFHTPAGEQQFASQDGVSSAIGMAQVLALAAARLTATT
jgi:metal-dependent amidase/aminoacylase/carboxypeptidase family protein